MFTRTIFPYDDFHLRTLRPFLSAGAVSVPQDEGGRDSIGVGRLQHHQGRPEAESGPPGAVSA